MPTKPDFLSMSLAEQLALFNSLVEEGDRRKSKFKNQRVGAEALEEAWAQARPADPPRASEKKRARKIKILVDRNPRRQKTGGHRYFDALRSSATVGEYLDKFTGVELRDANLWLYYNRKDGYVELVD